MWWSRVVAFFHHPLPQPLQERRERVRQDQREISQLLKEAFLQYEQRLSVFEERVRSIHRREDIVQELALLEESQQGLERLLKRVTIAEKETNHVLREWQDWQTTKQLRALTTHEGERLALLRGELISRGYVLPEGTVSSAKQLEKKPSIPKRSVYQPTVLAEDTLKEWDEVMKPRVQVERAFWDQRCAELPHGHLHSTAAFLYAKRKEAHGKEKEIGKK